MHPQLVTGEAVALDLREAALPSRMLAGAIDAAIQLTLLFLILIAGALFHFHVDSDAAALVVTFALLFGLGLGYPVLCETLMRGRSPGKAAMGLRVVREDGGPIGFRQAFVRGLIGFLVERPGITFFVGAVLFSIISTRGKRLGDLAAGTIVIQERVSNAAAGFVAPMPPPLAGWAETLDLSRVSDELALSIRSFLARAGQMNDQSRADLGSRLAGAVAAVTAPPPPPGTPGWAYLSAVLAERRWRAQLAVPQAVQPQAVQPPPSWQPPPANWTPSPSPSPSVSPSAPPPAATPPAPAPAPGGFVVPS